MSDNKYVPAFGPLGARLMILGEAPSFTEVETGRPFEGASGKELTRLCLDAGINRNECWISNACKYFVPPAGKGDKRPFYIRAEQFGIDMQEQLRDLQTEINTIKPNCILALGGTALWALSGKTKISNYRGSIMHGMGRKFVSTYHPAHLLHSASGGEIKGYWNRQVMIFDFKRALDESLSDVLDLPVRTLQVCTSSAQFEDFLKRYKDFDKPAVDIEALECIPSCIGLAFTPYEAISIPLWNVRGISKIYSAELVNLWMMLADVLSKNDIIGQNFKYDQDKIRRLGFIIRRLYSDTMLKAFVINPELPKNLAFNTSLYTREPYYKDEGAYFDITKQPIDNLYKYNAKDACCTKEIDMNMDADLDNLGLRDFYQNFVMRLHDLYLGIESKGFHIDNEKREALFEKYIAWSENIQHELYSIAGEHINVNSPKQVKIFLFDVLKCPIREGTGEEHLTSLLNLQSFNDLNKRRAVEIILEKRRVEKTIGTYLMAMPDYDGKMKTTYFLCLETGRTSTGQLDPPIRPQIEIKDEEGRKKKKSIGTAFQTITKHGDIGQDIRSQYVPARGNIFLQADSSQAEARVVFKLALDEQALKDIDEHDYHALTASWFFGGAESDYSKKVLGYESPIRFAGKTLRHAGHLGAGKRRAAIKLNTQARKYKIPIAITEAVAERALKIFHMKQPKIRSVFHQGIIKCLEVDKRYLTAPCPPEIKSATGGKRQFFERWGDELFRQAFSYIPQRTVSDNTKAAALRLWDKEGLIPIVESHDSLLYEVEERFADEIAPLIKYEFEKPIDFSTCSLPRSPLRIPCEVEYGYNYQELKKMKSVVIPEAARIIESLGVSRSITEEFIVHEEKKESDLTNIIYRDWELKQ